MSKELKEAQRLNMPPALPPKHVGMSREQRLSRTFLSQRRQELNSWMQMVALSEDFTSTRAYTEVRKEGSARSAAARCATRPPWRRLGLPQFFTDQWEMQTRKKRVALQLKAWASAVARAVK